VLAGEAFVLFDREPATDELLDPAELVVFVRRHERDRVARGVGSSGPADAVNVVLGKQRDIEIDDV